jgi:hypothetical protein
VSRRTARRILVLNLLLALLLSLGIGFRADTPAWSPITWGVLFLALTVFAGGPIALFLEWRVTDGWRRPNPYTAERMQVDEPLGAHRKP